jgi:predicted nucleic acid-binding Zn ribbon protein
MPTYEFRCPDGRIIERIFKISEVPDAIPTPDGSGMATRIISGGAGLVFKGSGFYITDYGKDGKKDQRSATASSSSSSGSTGGSEAGSSGAGSSTASESKSDSKSTSSTTSASTPAKSE